MILETQDVKKNDIFIYSLNKYDLAKNFKLINKDAKIKYPKSIHFNDVCRFFSDGRPKNIIVYRLLTNLPNLDPAMLKFGFVVNIDKAKEVVYFDPVYAIKELEEFSDIDSYPFLRFRIQQIGLISQLSHFGEPSFHEVYAFDLEVTEVKWQNDRVFAEIIFAFDEVHFDEEDADVPAEKNRDIPPRRFVAVTAEEVKSDLIEEDMEGNLSTIRKLRASPNKTAESLADDIQKEIRKRNTVEAVPLETSKLPGSTSFSRPRPAPAEPVKEEPKAAAPGPYVPKKKAEPTFGDFLNKVKHEIQDEPHEEEPTKRRGGEVINIFKTSAHIQDFVNERGKKQVVLKLRKR